MRLSEPNIVRMVRPLHDRDFISRNRMVGDGRARLIKITQEGLTALERFEPFAAEARKTLLQGVPDDEIELTNRILLGLLDKLPLISGADLENSDCDVQQLG
ncbi:MarR family winged helix-turn-helix transcriptional regulator [Brevundimonas vesicularis]|uniref:MarR family winged helix-turn-helix transcriptional regulator n=1 Tax=Brevundimonas vesicularis TaxID=41276 RepID=UPI0018ECE40B